MLAAKRTEVISAYVGRLRSRAESDGAIRINAAMISYGTESDEEGDEEPAEETASN